MKKLYHILSYSPMANTFLCGRMIGIGGTKKSTLFAPKATKE
jgi:hypothetical protein